MNMSNMSMSGRGCVAQEEKDGTEEEGIFVAGVRTGSGIKSTLDKRSSRT